MAVRLQSSASACLGLGISIQVDISGSRAGANGESAILSVLSILAPYDAVSIVGCRMRIDVGFAEIEDESGAHCTGEGEREAFDDFEFGCLDMNQCHEDSRQGILLTLLRIVTAR